MPHVPPRLVEAYRQARYHVHAPQAFELKIGLPSPAADRLMEQAGVGSAALLTAYNPRSRKTADPENAAAQATLRASLERYPLFEAEGSGPDWPTEPSLVALGISRSEAGALARRFRQHAYLFLETRRPVELVLVEEVA